jgi:deazaflavin-dependent oxidoreductase (nitroreductase family)
MADPALDVDALAAVEFCYLTTTGRVSGQPHTIEIWFVAHDGRAYLMAGDPRSDWVRNLRANPAVRLRVDGTEVPAVATVVDDAADPRQPVVRARMAAKYGEVEPDGSLNSWARTALLVAVDPREASGDAPVA